MIARFHRLLEGSCVAGVVIGFALWSAGCGCQEHEVSDVTITPTTACLFIQAGGGKEEPHAGEVGLCESLFLFGENNCSEPLVLFLPEPGDDGDRQHSVPAGEPIQVELPGWSERSYALEAHLGDQLLSISFSIGEQCGLTGDCS